MRISIGAPSYRISESEYAASLHPSQSAADGTAPEEILKKYHVQDMSQQDYNGLERDLWSSKNPESRYMGVMMSCSDVKQHYVDEVNGTPESPKSHYNFMEDIGEKYKEAVTDGSKNADYYLKLYQYMSRNSGEQI